MGLKCGTYPQDIHRRLGVSCPPAEMARRPAQWCQPSLSTSVLKSAGICCVSPSAAGTLHLPHGAPTAPQPQALGPSQGREMWLSQTQPVSSQRVHFITPI
jgi:hypothetical protein